MNMLEIMIIEDEKDHFELMEHAIKKEFPDAVVELCERADLCLERLEEGGVDIIIADYLLAGMTGLQLLEDLKERKIEAPVIMVTGHGDEGLAVKAMKSGAFDYVVKSGSFFELIPEIVRKAVHDRELKAKMRQAEEENKRLQAQFLQAQKMEAIGTLAAGIAHDFNNILAAIMGYTQLAMMKLPKGSDMRPDLDEVLQASRRARDLIQQIVTFSRERDKEKIPIEMIPLVKETLKFLRSSLPSSIEFREKLAERVGIIHANPTQIHQVIMNLCTNAAHAMQEAGGVLEVEVRNAERGMRNAELNLEPGRYLILSVSDTGCGIRPEIVKKIFDPYFTTKEKGVGTGLGLSVVHGIVMGHGGVVAVKSEPGKGSVFHVYFPLVQEVELLKAVTETPLPRGSEKILFVDDEPSLAGLGKRSLTRLGYDVVSGTSSMEALALFRNDPQKFDLVITDTTMPAMTGDRLAQEIMKVRPDMPIIICTGHSERISEEKAREMGIKAYLMKPLDMRDLAETVRRALGPTTEGQMTAKPNDASVQRPKSFGIDY